jgi:3-deoxy-D-manno-octulosonic-acid transferase/heptosyltransferase-1
MDPGEPQAVNILIVKLSAIGDVIHTLPALAALRRRYPDADITWVVEEAAADLLAGHPDLDRVLVSRRKAWLRDLRRGGIAAPLREMRAFLRDLRSHPYDLVIDFHGLLKSAAIVLLSGGKRKLGYDSLQEGSGLFYNEKIPEDLGKHAVDRYLDFVRHLAVDQDGRDAACLKVPPEFTITVGEEESRRVAALLAEHAQILFPAKADEPGGADATFSSASGEAAPEFRIAIGIEEQRRVAALLDQYSGILTSGGKGGANEGTGVGPEAEKNWGSGDHPSLKARKEAWEKEDDSSVPAMGERPLRQGADETRISRLRRGEEGRGRKSASDGEGYDFKKLDFVAVNPVAFWETKLWEDEKFAGLCDRIRTELGIGVVLTGGEAGPLERIRTRMKTEAINLGGKTSLRELACLYRRAAVVVSTDSGPMHLAAAVGTPVVALFGPTDPARTGPCGPGHRVIRGDLSCMPCFRKQCEDPRCMKGIGVEEVFAAVRGMLEGKTGRNVEGTRIPGGDDQDLETLRIFTERNGGRPDGARRDPRIAPGATRTTNETQEE